jgi:hypothetical protein
MDMVANQDRLQAMDIILSMDKYKIMDFKGI